MDKIIIPNPEKLQEKIERFRADGAGDIHVRSNFDGSLTLTYLDGKKLPSIISRLRQGGGYISEDYAVKSQELADYYRPIEYDNSITLEEKRAKMLEWWTRHYELLKEMGMSRQVLDKLTENERGNFRQGVDTFLATLRDHKIPMVIFSSSGIGNTISMFLKKEGFLHDNISILSNELLFDEDGKMTGVKEPIIHSYNKNEISIMKVSNYDDIKNRKDVIIIGDTLGDISMTEGFKYDEIIRIGFLSEDVEKHLEDYKKAYDIVILDDSNMDYVNELMQRILDTR
jgi:5'-nucleotidase